MKNELPQHFYGFKEILFASLKQTLEPMEIQSIKAAEKIIKLQYT
jgi:hypothetical protein